MSGQNGLNFIILKISLSAKEYSHHGRLRSSCREVVVTSVLTAGYKALTLLRLAERLIYITCSADPDNVRIGSYCIIGYLYGLICTRAANFEETPGENRRWHVRRTPKLSLVPSSFELVR